MAYLSHAVRRIQDQPVEGECVTLLVRSDDDPAELAERLSSLGTVEERLRFGTVKVTVTHDVVEEVCSLDGIQAVETVNTLAMDADGAGEDVDPVN